MFVPPIINSQFKNTKLSSFGLPFGVRPSGGKYRATANISFGQGQINLGSFDNMLDAHKAWQKQRVKTLTDLIGLSEHDVVNDRIIQKIEKIQFDIDNGLETE